jgi:energy-coupling factor transport system ATP-binding protein
MEAVKFENVSYKYRSGDESGEISSSEEVIKEYAVENVSFAIEKGKFVAIVGHNGSGKSTVAKLINGLLLPKSGDVTVLGINSRDQNRLFEIRKSVGMVFQNPDNQMIASIIEDDIAFGPENIGIEPAEISRRVDWALKCVNMEGFRTASSFRLSGGQKQRIAIAGVLAIKPQILVLDESTAMLDPLGRKEVLDVIMQLNKELGITVILITHFMEEAAKADKIIVLSDGIKALEGAPAEIFQKWEYLNEIGLSVPFASGVARRLNESGLNIGKAVLTVEELFSEICQLF